MILFVHLLFGAAMGSLIKNPILAVIAAFFGHYLLDFFPHIEYSIKKGPIFLKIFLDLFSGIALVFLLSYPPSLIIFLCAFFSILPDGLTVLSIMLPNKILGAHDAFHRKKLHFLKYKKIPLFWRFFSQAAFAAVSLYILF